MMEKVIEHGNESVCGTFHGISCIKKVHFNDIAEIVEKWVIMPFLQHLCSACSVAIDVIVIVIIVML